MPHTTRAAMLTGMQASMGKASTQQSRVCEVPVAP